jgi:ribosomal protein S18 acetylase RimI-like enzyme
MTVLDNPAWGALRGAQARFAEVSGRAARYQTDVSPFYALEDPDDPRSWSDMAAFVPPGGEFFVPIESHTPPPGWELVRKGGGVQMVGEHVYAAADPEAVVLSHGDIPEMRELVRRTEPGPFLPRTIELGRYVGFRRDGALVAMAGERMRPPGYTEISLVCTDPAYRGQRLATRLVETVIAGIRARGDTPFLHAMATNTAAISLYRAMGFTLRLDAIMSGYRRADF